MGLVDDPRLLRDVEPGDVDAYVRMRCDPAMMAELGGPLPRDGTEAKVETDVRKMRADDYWVSMIVPDAAAPEVVAGSVSLWSHEDGEESGLAEIGWRVLPEFQGRGYAKRAVRATHITATGLSRHVDPGLDGCVTVPDTPHHRALAESGWDNTGRFGDDASQVLPVDLNAQLFRYELDLAAISQMLGRSAAAAQWRARAKARRLLINRFLWSDSYGYRDYDLRTEGPVREVPRALSSFVPLWAGAAAPEQAARMLKWLPMFEHENGLASCEPGWADGTEHNYPTGWAYSHWYVAEALLRYGYQEYAARVSLKWLRLVAAEFEARQVPGTLQRRGP